MDFLCGRDIPIYMLSSQFEENIEFRKDEGAKLFRLPEGVGGGMRGPGEFICRQR